MAEQLIGKVNHWFGRIDVAGIELTDKLAVGDSIHILGHTTDFEQKITSMQIMHQDVNEAGPGDDVGVKVQFRARVGDRVYKVTES
ncbi:MAG: translation elongation factor-like protein [Anaerolineae bacterium]|nr:translation elongation factor-like protein [Anaerolineae bacterium]